MPRGISLHVGINDYSLSFPGATTLEGCEKDAKAMEQIAEANGFIERDVLLGDDATYMRVTTKIRSAAAQLEKGDIFFFSFAGHGFQHVDQGNDNDEQEDYLDETLLLVDAEVFDDFFRKELWPSFNAGVRVLMIADSCHSGTLHLVPPLDPQGSPPDESPVSPGGRLRTISQATANKHKANWGEFYRNTVLPLLSETITANVLHLGACEDHERTRDGKDNGVYTAAMLKVLKESKVKDYDDLVNKIRDELGAQGLTQNPTINTAGQVSNFRKEKPFTVNAS
jgi:hypothetical protein